MDVGFLRQFLPIDGGGFSAGNVNELPFRGNQDALGDHAQRPELRDGDEGAHDAPHGGAKEKGHRRLQRRNPRLPLHDLRNQDIALDLLQADIEGQDNKGVYLSSGQGHGEGGNGGQGRSQNGDELADAGQDGEHEG